MENFYELLKVHPKATIAEIVAAYHSAKSAFSKDSVATYSLFSADETTDILKKLEEAYLTLSNIEKRVEYDKSLSRKGYSENVDFQAEGSPVVSFMSGNPWKEEETKPESEKRELKLVASAEMMKIETEVISGEELKKIRENRGLSIEDVARITKIPTRFVINLEADLFKELPARVYVQGFIKNMAGLYRVEMNTLVKAYLKHWDQSSTKTSV